MLIEVAFWFALAGSLFSGYIAAHRLIVHECPFDEECPEFMGRPACEYGFGMFLSIFIVAALAKTGHLAAFEAHTIVYWFALAGSLFSGYYIAREVMAWLRIGRKNYGLKLPTCVYGFFCFVALFVFASVL